uniref:Uncharacterized protein n=1 Tax=Candidatus Kentrum eta TaxID=2126337 RepID=A0A450UJ87_9GAMM|nr:MAG: hypothetical protein BECKH772A_GA0070896_100321 [Candidatus Kentron sp. H]VFJ92622.1 MAG: hypothetical protein BECKH772B_GA0070898_1003135 [Candidatus Kentron sp. H]VFJ99314.1 MAG: hypothetical protein BECKH772C_GA0070978_100311 [Candidatus Kentron sp. H]
MIDDADDISFGGAKEKIIGKAIGAGIKTATKEVAPVGGGVATGNLISEDVSDQIPEESEGLLEAAGDILRGIWEGIVGDLRRFFSPKLRLGAYSWRLRLSNSKEKV